MGEQVTNTQLANKIGDMQGAIGRIEGLLVGISAELLSSHSKFSEIDTRLRNVETTIPPDTEKRLRKVESKLVAYSSIAAFISGAVGIFGKYIVDKIFS